MGVSLIYYFLLAEVLEEWRRAMRVAALFASASILFSVAMLLLSHRAPLEERGEDAETGEAPPEEGVVVYTPAKGFALVSRRRAAQLERSRMRAQGRDSAPEWIKRRRRMREGLDRYYDWFREAERQMYRCDHLQLRLKDGLPFCEYTNVPASRYENIPTSKDWMGGLERGGIKTGLLKEIAHSCLPIKGRGFCGRYKVPRCRYFKERRPLSLEEIVKCLSLEGRCGIIRSNMS